MNKYIAVMMVACVSAIVPMSVNAQNPEDGPSLWRPTATVKVYNNYISPSLGANFYDDPVIQSDIYVPMPYGFGFDVWHSSGFNSNLSGDWDDEIDYILTWDGSFGPVGLTLGAEYWDLYDPVGSFGGEDAWAYSARISAPVIELLGTSTDTNGVTSTSVVATPYAEGKIYEVGSDFVGGGGSVWFIGMNSVATEPYGFPCTAEIDYAVGYDDGSFGASEAGIFRFSSSLTWNWGGQLSIVLPDVMVSAPFNNDDERETETAFGGGLTYDF